MLPKMWKRVMITFALSFAIDFCYGNLMERAGALMIRPLFPEQINATEIVTTKSIIGSTLVFLYLAIYVYISIIRNLAATVSVIEDLSGIKAMIKSMTLIKGKIGVAVFMWLVLSYCFAVIDVIYFSSKSHEVTMRVLKTQSHQTNFKSIWWSVLDPLME
ncbi:hypothetical protein Patl1_27949 [Pistacia atlantica]|uniref:Uncharacterized protein n=1 Tax=Pistacia atlantica TaxID=434234 RepID=A0ACC1BD44_9ROSI|nr:hypothetical protein Patl1_27949 [Pistacia atlantica]